MANKKIELIDFNVENYEKLKKKMKMTDAAIAKRLDISTKTIQRYKQRHVAPPFLIRYLSLLFDVRKEILSDSKSSNKITEQELYDLAGKLSACDIGLLASYWLYQRSETDMFGFLDLLDSKYEFECHKKE